ncbi:MAG: phage tail protein [Paracoccus sp. (in: a-proteobacteria)]
MINNSLLPPNATTDEKLLEQGLRIAPPLYPLADQLLQLRTARPESLANWMAGEWGIAQFRTYFSDNTTFFDATLPWLQMRGTAAAVKTALGWLNVSAELDVEHFYLHISLTTPYYGAWRDFNRAVRQSIPLHLDYYRVFAGYDLRHGSYDESRYDDCLYDADSGVLIDDVLVSYGERKTEQTVINMSVGVAMTAITAFDSIRRWTGGWDETMWATNMRMLETQI